MPEKQPVQLQYEPRPPQQRGWKEIVWKFLARLSRPMPMGMYFVIMFGLSVIASVIAAIIMAIVNAFR